MSRALHSIVFCASFFNMRTSFTHTTTGLLLFICGSLLSPIQGAAQTDSVSTSVEDTAIVADTATGKVLYGVASYYANKFEGRKTANGEIFRQNKLTAACNVLPLGTWIRVTNLRNGRSVVVKTNDRLHHRVKRLVDLTRSAAEKLHFIDRGLVKVKIEVIRRPKSKR